MPKIQQRTIDTESFLKLKNDPHVINCTICNTEIELALSISIYEQFMKRRHDLQMYQLKNEEATGYALILVKRGKFNEQKYFNALKKYFLKPSITLGDILADECMLNHCITQNEEVFKEAVKIMKRSIEYCLHPSRSEVIQIVFPNTPQLYAALLIQDGFSDEFFEEE